MNKNYLIAVAVSIVLFVGFMFYRSHRNKAENEAYREKQTQHMMKIARSSPRAGLAEMGRVLKRYHADHGSYPAVLADLYPDYIRSKPYLTEVEWYYEPKKDDFYLSKTTEIDNKKYVASVDKNLMPEMEREIMVARPTPVTPAKPLKRPGPVTEKETPEQISDLALARKRFFEALSRGQIGVASVYSPQEDEVRLISTLIPEVLSTSTAEGVDIESELSRNYLVWKGEGGVLGFGNIQYPSTDRLSIFAIGQWYNLRMPPQAAPENLAGNTPQTVKTPELLASELHQNFLVWKDDTGSVGFGNRDYPIRHLETIFQDDTWQGLPREFEASSQPKEAARNTGPSSKERIISELGGRYLVWRDKDGTVGFGNVQYPPRGLDKVLQQGNWLQMEPEPVRIRPGTHRKGETPAQQSEQEVVSQFAGQFLVWRDKAGTVGFGNTQYPEKDVSAVYCTGRWEATKAGPPMGKTGIRETNRTEDAEPGTRFASKLSTGYLVWRGKEGTLGFGNSQYPETEDVSSICVNGYWQPVPN